MHRTSDIRMSEDTCTHPQNACKECSRLLKLTATAIIDFARQIGAGVIMEGVETDAELRVAADLGADMVQGFLTGRPQPATVAGGRIDESATPRNRR